jgi:hypothetical protein
MAKKQTSPAEEHDKVREAETVTLKNDRGGELVFEGYSYAETSFYDNRTGVLTKQELYALKDGRQAFSIVSVEGDKRSRRAYVVQREGEMCRINDGSSELSVPMESIMDFARMLLEIDADNARRLQASRAKTVNG